MTGVDSATQGSRTEVWGLEGLPLELACVAM